MARNVPENQIFTVTLTNGIIEESGADFNKIVDNKVLTGTNKYVLSGANDDIEANVGFVTESIGSAEASNDDWFAHGLSGQPDFIQLTVSEVDANYVAQIHSSNATHIQLYLYDLDAAGVEATDKTIEFIAKYIP